MSVYDFVRLFYLVRFLCKMLLYNIVHVCFSIFVSLFYCYLTVGHEQRSPLGVQLFGTFVLFPRRQAAADRLSGNPAMSRDENDHRRTVDRAGK